MLNKFRLNLRSKTHVDISKIVENSAEDVRETSKSRWRRVFPAGWKFRLKVFAALSVIVLLLNILIITSPIGRGRPNRYGTKILFSGSCSQANNISHLL